MRRQSVFTRLRDERGVSTVIVAVALVALFGALVLSLDTGDLWQSRRAMVTATDSGATRGAIVAGTSNTALSVGSSDPCPNGTDPTLPNVEAEVIAMLTANSSSATLDACTITNTLPHVGWLTVDARKPVSNRFGAVVGVAGEGSAFSSTTVEFGYPPAVVGLRPIGLCVEGEHVGEWLHLKDNSNPYGSPDPFSVQHGAGEDDQEAFDGLPITEPVYTAGDHIGETAHYYWNDDTDHVTHRIFFTKDGPEECGSNAPGNWAFQDYDGGANSNDDLEEWIRFGYHENNVGIGNCNWDDPPPNEGCEGDPGSGGGSLQSALNAIKNTRFPIVIYDSVSGNGATAEFNVYAFLGVILREFKVTGPESDRYFDLEFSDIQLAGPCCDDEGVWTGALNLRICSVDHDPQTLESRCTPDSP